MSFQYFLGKSGVAASYQITASTVPAYLDAEAPDISFSNVPPSGQVLFIATDDQVWMRWQIKDEVMPGLDISDWVTVDNKPQSDVLRPHDEVYV